MHIRLLIIFSLLTLCSFGQGLDVDNVYDFSPTKLTKAEQEKKLPTLDSFWDKVKSDTAKNLPLLRNELNTSNHNPFFYYDGSILLISLTKGNEDKTIAANAIAKCDLADINQKEYVETINRLSNDGVNVTGAAVKILRDTSFSFFLPQHVMYFKQGDCLTYMLLPQKPEFYIDTLISLFKSANSNSQQSILYALWFTYTCKGDSLIDAAAHDKKLNKEVVAFAAEMLKSPELSKGINEQIKSMDKAKADQIRKESLQRFSDEALDELLISSLALRTNTNCR